MRADTAVVCVRSRFFIASSRFHSYRYPMLPKPPASCMAFTRSR